MLKGTAGSAKHYMQLLLNKYNDVLWKDNLSEGG